MTIIKINNINELETVRIKTDRKVEIHFTSENMTYCFMIRLKRSCKKLLVLSNGAIDPSKKTPPVFMRNKWSDDFKSSHIFLDDPTIHKNGLKIGWGQGVEGEFALEVYNEIISILVKRLSVEDENVFYYGSSAGGFTSLLLASMHKQSKAIVNNPQTNVIKYAENFAVPLIESVYGSVDYAYENYSHRLDVIEAFKYYENTPKILYIQNRLCKSDMVRHYTPFMQKMNKEKLNFEQLQSFLYHNKKAGHNPLGKDETVKIINSTMDVGE